MPTRDGAPLGSPCWIDCGPPTWADAGSTRSSSDGKLRSRAQNSAATSCSPATACPSPAAWRDGDLPADNSWKVYLASDDIERTVKSAVSAGAEIMFPTMAVADLGVQSSSSIRPARPSPLAVRTFSGFTVLGEPARRAGSSCAHATMRPPSTSTAPRFGGRRRDERHRSFRYTTMRDPARGQLAGIMDATGVLAEGVPATWSVYWDTDDVDTAVAKVRELGARS